VTADQPPTICGGGLLSDGAYGAVLPEHILNFMRTASISAIASCRWQRAGQGADYVRMYVRDCTACVLRTPSADTGCLLRCCHQQLSLHCSRLHHIRTCNPEAVRPVVCCHPRHFETSTHAMAAVTSAPATQRRFTPPFGIGHGDSSTTRDRAVSDVQSLVEGYPRGVPAARPALLARGVAVVSAPATPRRFAPSFAAT
jgi:hypothetical protein